MHRKTVALTLLVICMITSLFAQTNERPERIHELFFYGSINETDEVLLHLIIKDSATITGFCVKNSEAKTDISGSFNDGGKDVELVETLKGMFVGKIQGQLTGSHFSGFWTQGTKEAQFNLTLFSVAVTRDTSISDRLYSTVRYPHVLNNADMNNEILRQIVDDSDIQHDDIDIMYESDYSYGFYIQTDFRFVYVREKITSIEFLYYAYTGGAHGNWMYQTLTFLHDDTSANLLIIEQLFSYDNTAEEYISNMIISDLYEQEAYFVMEGMLTELSFSDLRAFTLSKTGITFLFSPYQVGSYAQGGFEVFIPYADVEEFIDPEILAVLQYEVNDQE